MILMAYDKVVKKSPTREDARHRGPLAELAKPSSTDLSTDYVDKGFTAV